MKTILAYIYTNNIDANQINVDVFLAAGKYMIKGLVDLCAEYLQANLSLENALGIIITAHLADSHQLMNAAITFAMTQSGELTMPDNWEDIKRNNPHIAGFIKGIAFKRSGTRPKVILRPGGTGGPKKHKKNTDV